MAPSSSLVRKPDLQSGNEEFESPRGHHIYIKFATLCTSKIWIKAWIARKVGVTTWFDTL